ncbi:MAG: hypothetical protein DMF11_03810 [Verrucomicrobia bacterium]|nr:MAG: hypothetical protein DMF11_03810 [Verrucomicrobiota bacterium]
MRAGRFPLLYPTVSFAVLLFVLGAIWYAASSQNSPAVYLLLFGLTAVFLVSIPHTLLNLADVTIAPESAKPAFAGEEVSVPVEIMNCSRATRRGIELVLPGSGGKRRRVDYIAAGKAARVTLRFPAKHRGEHRVGTFRLTSIYPLGFVRVVKKFASSQTYLVYPEPSGDPRLPTQRARSPHSRPQMELGEGDDFAGVRAYVPGESQHHIDWRAVARGQPLMTKQFAAEAEGSVRLDFFAVRFTGVEEKLSQLALWVIEAERVRRPYSLRLPNTDIAPAVGEAHFHRCMRSLSLFPEGERV